MALNQFIQGPFVAGAKEAVRRDHRDHEGLAAPKSIDQISR